MKKIYKILIAAVFFVLAFANVDIVLAKNLEYKAWRYDVNDDGYPDLVFRRYSLASAEMVEEYISKSSHDFIGNNWQYQYNGKRYTSKWIEPEVKGIYNPSEDSFITIGYTFHTAPSTVYSVVGLHDSVSKLIGLETIGTNYITNEFDIEKIEEHLTSEDLVASVIEEQTNITPIYTTYGVNGVFRDITLGTKVNISNIRPKEQMVYRYAIVVIDINDTPDDPSDDVNIYVEDRVIYYEQLKELRTALKNNGITNNTCYISDILISKALYDFGGYEVATTTSQFFDQYNKFGYSDEVWSDDVLGKESDATHSAINMFDNEIVLPQQAKRNVIVRHIDIGENRNLSYNIMQNAGRIDSDEQFIIVKDTPESEEKNAYHTGEDTVDVNGSLSIGAQEAYIGNIEIYQDIQKTALEDFPITTDASGKQFKYQCIGHNVVSAQTLETAYGNINSRINNNSYEKGTTVNYAGLTDEDETEWVIIDFYYTKIKEEDIVRVNHLFVDDDGKVYQVEKQNIKANDLAYTGILYTTPIKAIKPMFESIGDNAEIISYIQEQYFRPDNQAILVRTATSLLNDRLMFKISYIGYEVFNEHIPLKDLYGYKVNASKDWYKPFDTILGVLLKPENKQVNFYYYRHDPTVAAIPSKFLSMKYEITSKEYNGINYCTTCKNDSEESIASIPSGVDARAGVTGIARALTSAVHIEYVSPSENVREFDLKVTYNCGKQSLTVNMNNIRFSFGYFKVTELVADVLQKVTLYDTSEDGLFDWTDDKREIGMYKKPSVKVYGAYEIPGKDKDGIWTDKELGNWTHFVNIGLTDIVNSTVTVTRGNFLTPYMKVSANGTFLTEEEIKEVDANWDGKIDESDVQFAEARLNFYKDQLNAAKGIMDDTTTTVENLQKQYDENCSDDTTGTDNTTETNNVMTLYNAYSAAQEALDEAEDKIKELRETIAGLEDTINTLTNEITIANSDLATLNSQLTTLTGALDALTAEQTELDTKIKSLTLNKSQIESIQSYLDKIQDIKDEVNYHTRLRNHAMNVRTDADDMKTHANSMKENRKII